MDVLKTRFCGSSNYELPLDSIFNEFRHFFGFMKMKIHLKRSSRRLIKAIILVCGILVMILFILRYHLTNVDILRSSSSSRDRDPPYPGKMIILFMPQWWYPYNYYPFIQEANTFCPKCHFTENQSLFGVSDGVVFHGMRLPAKIPKRTSPSQLWIFMMFEPIVAYKWHTDYSHRSPSITNYDGLFNLTMTYRRDSDIYVPYGRFIPLEEQPRPGGRSFKEEWAFNIGAKGDPSHENITYNVTPSTEDFPRKKLAAWIVLHCTETLNKGLKKLEYLQDHVIFDIYENCGEEKCNSNGLITGTDGRIRIRNEYKFYLAFETMNCKDYVTDKFFDTLGVTDMVPVVYGGADYHGMFPPNSFINADDFRTLKDLADYLQYVSDKEDKWLEYFEWRQHYWVQNNRFLTGYCDLCEKIWEITESHDKNKTERSYPSIWNWWIYNKDGDEGSGPACEFYNGATIWDTGPHIEVPSWQKVK